MQKRMIVIGMFVLFTKIVLAQENNVLLGGNVSRIVCSLGYAYRL
jgi:hypothetical protein